MDFRKLIDHTALTSHTTQAGIKKLCYEAIKYKFCSVCINPAWVAFAKQLLQNSDVKVCTVVGFPLGANTSSVKAFEAKEAVVNGADEVDMVMNIGWAKEGKWAEVERDILTVTQAVSGKALVKVILETCLLTDEEIRQACQCALNAHADFVKTSTGFSTNGATVAVVKLMHECVGHRIGIKASGGIRTIEDVNNMVAAGATRIGTSAGVHLCNNRVEINQHNY